jgi:hypothetical protein
MVNKTGIPTLIGNETPVFQPVATGFAAELSPVIKYRKMYGRTQREVCGICQSRLLENCENSRLSSPKNSRLSSPKYDNQPAKGRRSTSLNEVT